MDDVTADLAPDARPRAHTAAARRQVQAGDQLGRYTLERLLGQGGMSQVYLAHDGLLDRRVAIKVLRVDSGFARPEERRLLREAQAIARLQHPNIIAVHDVGSVDGRTFVAMEFIAGRTLRQWARSDAPDPLAVAEVMHRAAEGIAAAHAASLLHRDIKPDNLMLADDGRVREGPSLAGCDLPASLVQLLERALAFDPDRRLPDMAVLCDILERIVHGPRRRKRRVRAAAIAVGLVVAGTTGFFAAGAQPRPAPSAMAEPHVEQVERLSEQATQAAASARFVYPPPSDPAAATAILKVLELEALSGPGMQLAAEHASTLRTRFADALEALGDRYWDRPGGKMFSADFYSAWARGKGATSCRDLSRYTIPTGGSGCGTADDSRAPTLARCDRVLGATPQRLCQRRDVTHSRSDSTHVDAAAALWHRDRLQASRVRRLGEDRRTRGALPRYCSAGRMGRGRGGDCRARSARWRQRTDRGRHEEGWCLAARNENHAAA